MKLVAIVKHFTIIPEGYRNTADYLVPEGKMFDYDEEFVFDYDMHTLRLQGSNWSKQATPDIIAETVRDYFKGTNYVLADIYKRLD